MRVDDEAPDVPEPGREPGRRRWSALVVLAVALVTALGGGYLDRRSRQAEFAAISGCAQRAATGYDDSTARLTAIAEYVRPSLVYAPEATATGLYGMVAHEARTIGPLPQRDRDRCAAVEVHGWHTAQRTALTAQLRLQDAQLALLARTATTGRAFYGDQDQVSQLRSAAASALAAARPVVAP